MPLEPAFFADKILGPIRRILQPLLQAAVGDAATDPAARERLISLADLVLISDYPQARVIPSALRRQLIALVLNSLLGTAAAPLSFEAAPDADANMQAAMAQIPPDQISALTMGAPGDSVRGFVIDGESDDEAAVGAAVAATLGADSTVEKIPRTSASFFASAPGRVLSVREAWDLAHGLAAHPHITAAEPVIEWVPAPPDLGGAHENMAALMLAASGQAPKLSCATDPKWSVDAVNAAGAWAESIQKNRPEQGKGIKVAHLDTGITYHQDLPDPNGPSIILNKGANFYDAAHTNDLPLDPMDAGPLDILRTWFIPLNGHGTGTLSVLLCPEGKQIVGTAPQAIAMPVRIGPTVVHWNLQRIISGIGYAHEQGCDVITMSMGGPPPVTRALQEVIDTAVDNGMIFCSAAGNVIGNQDWFPVVVWPAAMDKVIAVGGGNCKGEAWDGSSRGPEVNISAEAQDVWHADAVKGAIQPGGPVGTTASPGNGTSFATPATAGLAACWLAHHGISNLVAKYGNRRYIPLAFAYLLRTVAFNTPANWKTKLLGPGIIDGAKLLQAALPDKALLADWPVKTHTLASNLVGGIFKLLFPITSSLAAASAQGGSSTTMAAVAAQQTESEVLAQRFRGEILYHLFDRPALGEAVIKQLSATPAAANPEAASFAAVDLSPQVISTLKAIGSPALQKALESR